jgi:hypothetical protein
VVIDELAEMTTRVARMPDLDAVYDELSRRLSRHEAAFRASDNPTYANAARSRKVARDQADGRSDAGFYLLLGAPTEKYPDGQMFASVRRGKR